MFRECWAASCSWTLPLSPSAAFFLLTDDCPDLADALSPSAQWFVLEMAFSVIASLKAAP